MKLPNSTHVDFREFEESDWSAVHSYAGNLDTVQYMDWGPNSEEDTKTFIKLTLDSQKQTPRTNFDFAVIDKSTGLLIGTAGVRIQDTQSLVGDFGYILHLSYWGRGLGTAVAQAIVAFGFQELGLHRIWATCRPQNVASARVLEKAGLKCEGYLRENKRIRGTWTDSYLYAITKTDFNPAKATELKSKNEKSITIREARIEDASLLAEEERKITSTPGFLVSKPHELLDENFKQKIEFLSKSKNGKYIVAEIDGKIAGHALLDPLHLTAIRHVVHLTIAVHNGWQEMGVGQEMLSFLIEWAKQSPVVEKIELHVRSCNGRAMNLYRKVGFQEEGRWRRRVKIEEGKYLDDVLMGLWVGN